MNDLLYAAEDSLGYMTITANRLMSSLLRRRMRSAGVDLTAEQWGVLVLLWNLGNTTQEELAHRACVDKSSMSRLLSLMEDKGLVSRKVDPSNERRKIICASDKALELRTRGLAAAREALGMALKGVSPEECATCLKVLASIKKNLQEETK